LNTLVQFSYIRVNNLEVKKVQSLLKFYVRTISFMLIVSIVFFSSEVFAQSGLRVFDEIGGGSGTTSSQSDDSNDDTALYVLGGLVVAGIIVYALVIKKDKKSDADSTKSPESKLRLSELSDFDSPEYELQKVKDKIPVDIIMGVKNNQAFLNDKTYLLGVRVKL